MEQYVIPDTMTALRKLENAPGANLVTIPVPEIGIDDVLVRVDAASICGTDLHILEWDDWSRNRVKTPMTLGHEMAGTVVATGTNVDPSLIGEFISCESHITCGLCFQCKSGSPHMCPNTSIIGVDRDGCFAEYLAVPEKILWRTDRSKLQPEIAALQESFGGAVRSSLVHDPKNKNVAVLGCGPIGLFSIAVLKAAGASQVIATDTNKYRLSLALEMGADAVFNPSQTTPDGTVKWLTNTGKHGVDIILEMSGAPASITAAFKGVRKGGYVNLFGIPAKPILVDVAEDLIFKNLTVLALNGREIFETWHKTRELLETKLVDLKPLITHTLPLDNIMDAFDLLKKGNACKIVIKPELK
jgi:threonine 3-dehydrogenase